MPSRRTRRNPPLPSAPPKRRFAGQPAASKQTASALARVRQFSSEHGGREKPFDPSRAPSWRGSSRDLVVNGSRLDAFTTAFLETALWSTNDESRDDGGDPLDKNYSISDIDPKSIEGLKSDCERFQEENAKWIEQGQFDNNDSRAGHDFWLNRNGHGAGFWDGDWPEPAASKLDAASKKFGEVNLYIGDDGVIYAMGYEDGPRLRRNGGGRIRRNGAEIEMPEFDWEQIDGDVNLPQYGGIIARCDGDQIDLVEIQPVREYVGDGEAQEVGFPFWTKEASYYVTDLDPSHKEVRAALQSSDVNLDEIEPAWRARAIALACMRYGHGSEEGDGGWAGDKRPDEEGRGNLLGSRKVRWGYVGHDRKTFAEEASGDDDDFRREVMGEEEPKYTYKMSYEIVTPESAEDGEAEERGWEEEGSGEYDSLSDVLNDSDIRNKSWIEWSDSTPSARSWLISEADQDFSSGADTTYNLWIERADGEPLSQDELKTISSTLGVRMR